MRLRSEQLSKHLSQSPALIYFVSGDEPLLMQESCDTIRKYFREQGFSERDVMHVESGFDWQQLLGSARSMSLFAERKLIELRLNNPKPGDAGSKALQEYVKDLNPDTALLISSSKIDAGTQKTKWFKAIEQHGAVIQLWPIDARQLPNWIKQRLQRHGLRADTDALRLIAEKVEGNLLAAAQEVDKLALMADNDVITAQAVSDAVADNSRYNLFALVDNCLAGQAKEALRALHGLQAEGGEPTVILWAFSREIRLLQDARFMLDQGQSLSHFFSKQRVFEKHKPLMQSALRRLSANDLFTMLQQCQKIDLSIKGMHQASVWDELDQLIMQLAGKPIEVL